MSGPRQPPAEALDLPDLDRTEEDAEIDVGTFDLSLDEQPDQIPEHEAFEDSFQVQIENLTDSGSNEAASDLDVGVEDLLGTLPDSPREAAEDEPSTAGAEDLDSHLDAPLGSDDPSSEEELGDDGLEPLPELARDHDGEEGPEVEGSMLAVAPEGALERGPQYEIEWLLLGAPCTALSAGPSAVLAAAERLMQFGHERRSEPLPPGESATSLAAAGEAVVIATRRGLLERAADGSWCSVSLPESRGSDVLDLAAVSGERRLWARLASGALLNRRVGGWERHETGGEVRALSADGSTLTLVVLSRRPTLQLSDDAGSSFREVLLPEPARAIALGAAPCAVARGRIIALADPQRGLCVSTDGGETFRSVTGAVNVTALCVGEHAGQLAIFAALHREARDVTEIILINPESARALSIAEIAAEPEEDSEELGRTQALIFANDQLWAAGGYGLARLSFR